MSLPLWVLYGIQNQIFLHSSHALPLFFTCKHRVAKFNLCYTFNRFPYIYIYIYIYYALKKSFPFIKDCMTYTPFWIELELCTAGVVSSVWGFLLGYEPLNPIIWYYVWHFVWLNVVINKFVLLLSKIMVTWIFGHYHIVLEMHSIWFMWFGHIRYKSQVFCKPKILVRSRW